MVLGRKTSSFDPISAPLVSARPTSAAAFTAARCWRMRPGFWRRARMLVMRSSALETSERAREVRRIWPPPSPKDPSTVSMGRPSVPFLEDGVPANLDHLFAALHLNDAGVFASRDELHNVLPLDALRLGRGDGDGRVPLHGVGGGPVIADGLVFEGAVEADAGDPVRGAAVIGLLGFVRLLLEGDFDHAAGGLHGGDRILGLAAVVAVAIALLIERL